jgi:hypothetical protein
VRTLCGHILLDVLRSVAGILLLCFTLRFIKLAFSLGLSAASQAANGVFQRAFGLTPATSICFARE